MYKAPPQRLSSRILENKLDRMQAELDIIIDDTVNKLNAEMRAELDKIVDQHGYQEMADGYEQAIEFVMNFIKENRK